MPPAELAAVVASPASVPEKATVTVVEAKDADCLEEAARLIEAGGGGDGGRSGGGRVAVLNMANALTPGGGFRGGLGAQVCAYARDES